MFLKDERMANDADQLVSSLKTEHYLLQKSCTFHQSADCIVNNQLQHLTCIHTCSHAYFPAKIESEICDQQGTWQRL